MAKKLKLFLYNAMGLLCYKLIDDPDQFAAAIDCAIDHSTRFTFDNSTYDRTEDARIYSARVRLSLINRWKGKGER